MNPGEKRLLEPDTEAKAAFVAFSMYLRLVADRYRSSVPEQSRTDLYYVSQDDRVVEHTRKIRKILDHGQEVIEFRNTGSYRMNQLYEVLGADRLPDTVDEIEKWSLVMGFFAEHTAKKGYEGPEIDELADFDKGLIQITSVWWLFSRAIALIFNGLAAFIKQGFVGSLLLVISSVCIGFSVWKVVTIAGAPAYTALIAGIGTGTAFPGLLEKIKPAGKRPR